MGVFTAACGVYCCVCVFFCVEIVFSLSMGLGSLEGTGEVYLHTAVPAAFLVHVGPVV